MNELNQQVSDAINRETPTLAALMVTREFAAHPELDHSYGEIGREKCLKDAAYHLAYLAQAVAAGSSELFGNYVGWAKVMLAKRGVPPEDLSSLLMIMKESLGEKLPPEFGSLACDYVETGIRQLPGFPDDLVSCIGVGTTPLGAMANEYLQSLLAGKREIASHLVLDAIERKVSVRDIYLEVFQSTQYEIGRLWQMNEISVAQEHYCTAATQLIMSQLYPQIFATAKTEGTMVATCVSGDLHEIGVRMVCDFFEIEGWNTYYLGANVPLSSVIQAVIERKASVLCISATITYHVRAVELLIAAARGTPECSGLKILVGGYPFKVAPDLWKDIGADGFASDAQEAMLLLQRVMSGKPVVINRPPTSAAQKVAAPSSPKLNRRDDHFYEELSRTNNELANLQRELARKNQELLKEMAARKLAEEALEQTHREHVEMSRKAGMSEIATNVLHNVGNVLNSVNVSVDRISDKVKRLAPASLAKVAALLREHTLDLPAYLSLDAQGKQLPAYLCVVADQLSDPLKEIQPEMDSLRKNVEHIREIVRLQQSYAHVSGVPEPIDLAGLVEDALRMSAASFTRHDVRVIREFSPVPPVRVEKHKVLQILVNLLTNGKQALDAGRQSDKELTVRIGTAETNNVEVSIIDNGEGIAAEKLTQIFQHGFTTRKDGHGFGLHSSANAATEMGGTLKARSEGAGRGATFTLTLPCQANAAAV